MEKVYSTGFNNPFLPLGIYIPDGEPKVFGNRVYLYGSKDYFGGEYCCHKYHVYSAPLDNLQEWTDHGPALASTDEYADEGINDGVPWSDGLLWAPDIVKKGDWYYLYFCLSDGTEGVAKSRVPQGPFTDARQICMNGEPVTGIDPSVLQDGDKYYYTWGQGDCRMARLNDDMCTLDPESFKDSLISHRDGMQGFHEGSSLRKIGDWYCIVYASEYRSEYPNNGGTPVRLDYAVSRNPEGPYERRGTVIDNTGIDPSSWNNHGSIIRLKDQWYVFYHGSSNNSKYTRRARVERICVNEETGFIEQAEMTSSGFAEYIDPMQEQQAAYACSVSGGAWFTEKDGCYPMVNIRSGSSALYRYFNFGDKPEDWYITIKGQLLSGGRAKVYVNSELKAEIELASEADSVIGRGILCGLTGKAGIKIEFTAEHASEIVQMNSFALSL